MLFYFYNFILNIVYAPSKKKKKVSYKCTYLVLHSCPFPLPILMGIGSAV